MEISEQTSTKDRERGAKEGACLARGRRLSSDLAGGSQFLWKQQCPNYSSSRDLQNEPRSSKANSQSNQSKADQVSQTSPHAHQPTRNMASTSGKLHQFKSKDQGIQKPAVPASNLKRRGPGRPRKYFVPSHPSPVPEHATFLTEESNESEKVGKDDIDTVMEVIELVIQGEQRSPNKRTDAVQERNGDQNQKQGTEGTTRSEVDFNIPLPPLSPSPARAEERRPEKGPVLPPNKKYLWAGLYSDDYKNENIPDEPRRLSADSPEFDPEDHDYGLLPPPLHVGKYLRLKRINFQLPYDIYWLCAHNKLFEKPVTPPHSRSNSPSKAPDSVVPQSSSDHPLTPLDGDQADGHVYECREDHTHHHLLTQQEGNWDNENFPSPLSSEERSFVIEHGVFLMRNYKKMKVRQALLLRGGAEEQEDGDDKPNESTEDGSAEEDPTIMSDRCQIEQSLSSQDEERTADRSKNLERVLQEIWDRIVSCKGSSGQTLTDPLLNLCTRKRADSALMDLTRVREQMLSGHYESLEAFHRDMQSVFQCAEKYYGAESPVGRDVRRLRDVYDSAHQKASAHSL